MPPRFDAIIMGAGPAGSTAAILLARAGWSVALIEKQSFPRRKVCGECIAASNLSLLDALGIGQEFVARAGPELHRVAVMLGDATICADMPAFDHPLYRWGRALGRESLDILLLARARAAGVTVWQPWSVRSLAEVAGEYCFTIRATGSHDETFLRTPIAIAAHGSWEPSPISEAGQRGSGHRDHMLAFKANFRNVLLAKNVLSVLSFEGGYGGMVLADRGIATVACCVRADRLAELRRTAPGIPAGEVIGGMLRLECAGVGAALRNARQVGTWVASGPLRPGIRLCKDDHILRIGNAAGEAHPIIGEGISMAMQSAWLLCAHLLRMRRQAGPNHRLRLRAVRDGYAADWRRHFSHRIRLAAVIANLAMHPRVAVQLLPLLRLWVGLIKCVARWGGKVHCAIDPATIEWLAAGEERKEIATLTLM